MGGGGAEDEFADPRMAVGAHDDEVGADGFTELKDFFFGITMQDFPMGFDATSQRPLFCLLNND
jgi:hypothetical protein